MVASTAKKKRDVSKSVWDVRERGKCSASATSNGVFREGIFLSWSDDSRSRPSWTLDELVQVLGGKTLNGLLLYIQTHMQAQCHAKFLQCPAKPHMDSGPRTTLLAVQAYKEIPA